MPATSMEQLGQLALSMWATQAMAAFDLLFKTERRVLEEGIPAVLQPQQAPNARQIFLDAVQRAASPADLEAAFQQRVAQVGWEATVKDFATLGRPPRNV
jgi:hypothetical protein